MDTATRKRLREEARERFRRGARLMRLLITFGFLVTAGFPLVSRADCHHCTRAQITCTSGAALTAIEGCNSRFLSCMAACSASSAVQGAVQSAAPSALSQVPGVANLLGNIPGIPGLDIGGVIGVAGTVVGIMNLFDNRVEREQRKRAEARAEELRRAGLAKQAAEAEAAEALRRQQWELAKAAMLASLKNGQEQVAVPALPWPVTVFSDGTLTHMDFVPRLLEFKQVGPEDPDANHVTHTDKKSGHKVLDDCDGVVRVEGGVETCMGFVPSTLTDLDFKPVR